MPNLIARIRLAAAVTLMAVAGTSGLASAQAAETSPLPQSAGATLPAGTWEVVAFDPWNEGLVEPLEGSTLTLALLDDDELEGETGCGRFNGGWTIDEGDLRLGIAQTGYFGCADAQTEEAIGLSTAVDSVVGWRETASGIELVDQAGTPRLLLGRADTVEPTGDWTVIRYRRPNGRLTEPGPDQPMALEFSEYDRVAGSTGCRLLKGVYVRDGSSILIGPVETVGLPCEGEDRRAERQLLRALGEVIYWERSGDTLSLNDGFDELLVELVLTTDTEAYADPGATAEPSATTELGTTDE